MVTYGFTFNYSDLAVNDVAFPTRSAYLFVGGAGDIVYVGGDGNPQYFPGAAAGSFLPISTNMILSSGTVNGTSRDTTATGVVYCCSPTY